METEKETITAADVAKVPAEVIAPRVKLFAEIKADLKAIIAKAKAAWDAGEKELHSLFHAKAVAKAAEAGAAVSVSGKADGVLVAHDPTPQEDAADEAAKPE